MASSAYGSFNVVVYVTGHLNAVETLSRGDIIAKKIRFDRTEDDDDDDDVSIISGVGLHKRC